MLKVREYFDFEKKSVFLVNLLFIFFVLFIFYFDMSLSYFFYTNVIVTFFLSYFFFRHSKALAKTLILTNMFILFYFMYPAIAEFLYQLLGTQSYFFILFYNILLAYIFLVFSGFHKDFLGHLKHFNIKILGLIIVLGLVFGLLFFFVKEPFPSYFASEGSSLTSFFLSLAFWTLVLAISEQIIFSAFLLRSYEQLTTKFDAYLQVAGIFVLFHFLRFKQLVEFYFSNYDSNAIIYLSGYYLLLFLFMISCLYFYSMHGKYKGNFIYPVLLHFVTDFFLFFLFILG